MKHAKFKYHTWNKIRTFMNKPYAKGNYFALINAWWYFNQKYYLKQVY